MAEPEIADEASRGPMRGPREWWAVLNEDRWRDKSAVQKATLLLVLVVMAVGVAGGVVWPTRGDVLHSHALSYAVVVWLGYEVIDKIADQVGTHGRFDRGFDDVSKIVKAGYLIGTSGYLVGSLAATRNYFYSASLLGVIVGLLLASAAAGSRYPRPMASGSSAEGQAQS